jgi:uncharacterized membrane protein YfcA
MLSPEAIFIIILIASIIISTLVSMVGLGGGILFIPLLVLVFEIPIESAVAISLCGMTATTTSATISYWRQKKINYKLGLLYNILDIPGVILGAYLSKILPSWVLSLNAGAIIIALAALLLGKNVKKKCDDETVVLDNKKIVISEGGTQSCEIKEEIIKTNLRYPNLQEKFKVSWSKLWEGIPHPTLILLSSFLGGLITGMVGMGGGTADTTSMILSGVPIDIAAGTSAFAMMMTNVVGITTHGFLGNILWEYAIPLTIGAALGAQLGGLLCKRLNAQILKTVLCCLAIFAGLRLLLTPFF